MPFPRKRASEGMKLADLDDTKLYYSLGGFRLFFFQLAPEITITTAARIRISIVGPIISSRLESAGEAAVELMWRLIRERHLNSSDVAEV